MASTVWKGRLAFGMVSIPVRLYKAARRERIRFHHVYRPEDRYEPSSPPNLEENETPTPAAPKRNTQASPAPASSPPPPETVARIRSVPVGAVSDAPLEKPQILKGLEIEKHRYVTFEPRELAALRPQTSTELSIAEFVRLQEIDPIFFETSYYAAPDRGGEKPYALLFAALAETEYAAIGSLAMHGREHATVIRPGRRGLIIHALFYENEVRADEEYKTDSTLVSAKELELAKMVIRAMAVPFEANKSKDTFEERLRQLIDSRADMAASIHEHGEVGKRAPVIDIMEALRKSLEMARKPPKSETSEQSKAKSRQNRPRAAR
jgi:DNA end-binding protein Ku